MKLKKVTSLCSARNAFRLYDDERPGGEIRQWLGDGAACYLLSGLPILDENNVLAMFDVPEKKREKCRCEQGSMPPAVNPDDHESGERCVSDDWPTVQYDGRVVKPLSTLDGIVFIQSKYLAPLEDMADYLRLFERTSSGGNKYIVAKNGLEIVAIIMEYDVISAPFVEQLESLASKCRMELEKKRMKEPGVSALEEDGPLFQGDEEAEEGGAE